MFYITRTEISRLLAGGQFAAFRELTNKFIGPSSAQLSAESLSFSEQSHFAISDYAPARFLTNKGTMGVAYYEAIRSLLLIV